MWISSEEPFTISPTSWHHLQHESINLFHSVLKDSLSSSWLLGFWNCTLTPSLKLCYRPKRFSFFRNATVSMIIHECWMLKHWRSELGSGILQKNLFINFCIDSTLKTNKKATTCSRQHSLFHHTASSEFNSFCHKINRQSFASCSSGKSFSIRTNYVIVRFVAEINLAPHIVCPNIEIIRESEEFFLILFWDQRFLSWHSSK